MASPNFFETKAFDLTPEEKHANLGEIKSLLLRAGSRIQRAQMFGASEVDWYETLDLINRALIIAEDPDACDPSLSPLVSCYLYKGHILLAIGEEEKAYEEYEKAATGEAHSLTDFPGAQQAATILLEPFNQFLRFGKKGVSITQTPSQNVIPDPGEIFVLPGGIDEIPLVVALRPGSKRIRPQVVSGSNKSSKGKEPADNGEY